MSVIKQISVFNGSSWDTDNIGANAGNIDLLSADGTTASTIAGSTNLLTGLNNILPASQLTASRALIADANGKISSSNISTTILNTALSGASTSTSLQSQINTLNTNLFYVNADTSKAVGTFNGNFLLISTADRYANQNKTSYFSITTSTTASFSNVPPLMHINAGTIIGKREVLWRGSSHVLVKVTELYPRCGRQYYNFYNNGTWQGWQCFYSRGISTVKYLDQVVNNGYLEFPLSAFSTNEYTYDDFNTNKAMIIIQPLYKDSTNLSVWSGSPQVSKVNNVDTVTIYVRQGTSTPANGTKVSFWAICMYRY